MSCDIRNIVGRQVEEVNTLRQAQKTLSLPCAANVSVLLIDCEVNIPFQLLLVLNLVSKSQS